MKSFGSFIKESQEQLSEAGGKEGKYYSVELPAKGNDFKANLAGGPFNTFEDAKKKGGSRDYGLNQSHEIGIFVHGSLHHVDTSGEARDKKMSTNVGKSVDKVFESKAFNESALGKVQVDKPFTNLNNQASGIKDDWRDIRRMVNKQLDMPAKELDKIGDDIEDAIIDLKKALDRAQDKIKSYDK